MFLDQFSSAGFYKQAKILFIGAALSVSSITANAAAIVDQTPTTLAGSVAYYSGPTGGSQYADNFSLAAKTTITSIAWWGSYAVQGNDDFSLRIFSDSNANIASFSSSLAVSGEFERRETDQYDSGGLAEIFAYSLDLSAQSLDLILEAGNYYLAILNNDDVSPANNNNPSAWLWLGSNKGSSGALARQSDSDPWAATQDPNNFAFVLNGTQQPAQPRQDVPEPGMLSLLALGVAALARSRKR